MIKLLKNIQRQLSIERTENIPHIAELIPIYDNMIKGKLISVLIREIDVQQHKIEYFQTKILEDREHLVST